MDLLVAQNYVKWPLHRLKKLPGKAMMQIARGSNAAFFHVPEWNIDNKHYGQSPLIADLNDDSRPDVLWLNMDGPLRAFLNTSQNHFVTIRVPDDARSLGTTVFIETTEGRSYSRQMIAGAGLMTDQSPELVFGLNKSAEIRRIIISRPDGKTDTLKASKPQRRKANLD